MCSILVVIHCENERSVSCVISSTVFHAEEPDQTGLSTARNRGCRKCATNQAGKLSCCARGGAWFKNCGASGNKMFDHTWDQGIQACKGMTNSVLMKSPLSVILHQVRVTGYRLNTTQTRNTPQQHTNISISDDMPNAVATDSKDCVEFTTVAVSISAMLIISNLQTYLYHSCIFTILIYFNS